MKNWKTTTGAVLTAIGMTLKDQTQFWWVGYICTILGIVIVGALLKIMIKLELISLIPLLLLSGCAGLEGLRIQYSKPIGNGKAVISIDGKTVSIGIVGKFSKKSFTK